MKRRLRDHLANIKGFVQGADLTKLTKYLEHFQYLSPSASTAVDFLDAVERLQRDAGIRRDRVAGEQTMRTLDLPRCAVREAYSIGRGYWGKRALRWYVATYLTQISKADQRNLIAEGCSRFSEVCDLRFTKARSRSSADILIGATTSPQLGFGRRGGTLASAQLPPGKNWLKPLLLDFDSAELWTIDGIGTKYLNVFAHELGHILGLPHHTAGQKALMDPFYNPDVDRPLAADIKRLTRLYGDPQPATPPPPPLLSDVKEEVFLKPGQQILVIGKK